MEKLNGYDFKLMLKSANANLENHQNKINELNVFPVPDGDTGTNMCMTFNNGYKEASAALSNSLADVSKALSKGLLMGARGNSGVITSQIFRGFAKTCEGKDEIDVKDLSLAFENGAKVAYKAIMKPVEGTILTVIRESSWYANQDVIRGQIKTIEGYFNALCKYASESLDRTPDLLPALKDAGVVDSGGAGLLKILEGLKAYAEGNPFELKEEPVHINTEKRKIGYSIDFVLRLQDDYVKEFNPDLFKEKLIKYTENYHFERKEDDIVGNFDTLSPFDTLKAINRYGEFISINFVNNSLEPSEVKEEVVKEEKEYGIITVCSGDGLTNLFKELGADIVISGGQTMNPSCQDFVEKIKELSHCKHIFIFPNNSNIILAAKQAKDISSEDITVIETKSIQTGISAIAMFNYEGTVEDNETELSEYIKNIGTASITYAIKDTNFDGIEIKKHNYISIVNKEITGSDKDIFKCTSKAIDSLFEKGGEILTIITGEDASEKVTNKLVEYVKEKYNQDPSIIKGDQPVYTYLISLE